MKKKNFKEVSPETPIWKAWRELKSSGENCLLIKSVKEPLGVIGKRDLARIATLTSAENLPVEDLVENNIMVLGLEEPVIRLLEEICQSQCEYIVLQDFEGFAAKVIDMQTVLVKLKSYVTGSTAIASCRDFFGWVY